MTHRTYFESELTEILREGAEIVNAYIEEMDSERRLVEKTTGERANGFDLIPRVRLRSGSVAFEWLRPVWRGPVGKKKRHWRYIPRPEGRSKTISRMPISLLGRTSEWEREYFRDAENEFYQLRIRQRELKGCLKAMKDYAKLTEDDQLFEDLMQVSQLNVDWRTVVTPYNAEAEGSEQ